MHRLNRRRGPRSGRLADDETSPGRANGRGFRLRRGYARWRRHRDRRRSRGRSRRRDGRGQQPERIEVAERVGGEPDPEVDVRHRLFWRAARPDGRDDIPLRDRRALRDSDRAEMRQRDRVAVGRLDRQAFATRRHEAGEAHRPACGCDDRAARRCGADVDAAVLAGVVRMRLVVRERLEHRPLDGPAPRLGDRRPNEEHHENRCPLEQHREQR